MSSIKKPEWNLNRLYVFSAVAKTGSLKSAAYRLGMPQPSVSRQISRLEEECRGRLFDRTGRGMNLTELGEYVLQQADRIIEASESLTQQLEALDGKPFGNVKIGILPSLSVPLLLPLFFKVKQLYPGIRLQIFEGSAGQIDQWLLSGHIDVGIPYRYDTSDPLNSEILLGIDSCLIGAAGNPNVREPIIPFAALDGLPLILPSAPSGIRNTLDRLARRFNIALNIVIEADSTQLQTTITARGGSFTVLPRFAVTAGLKSGELQASRIVEPNIERHIVLATTSAHPLSYATRLIIQSLRQISIDSVELKTQLE